MNHRVFWLSLPLALGAAGTSLAQDATDAIRYSQLQFGGSARTIGIGGATVALGADYGSVSSNPAGLGLYQKSEIQLTPGVGVGQGEGRLFSGGTANSPLTQTANSFHLSGGVVFSSRRSRLSYAADSDWKGGSFALGFTRIADFNTGSNYQGTLRDGSNSLFQRLREPRTPLTGTDNGSIIEQSNNGYLNLDGVAYGAYLTDVQTGRRGQDTLVTQTRRGAIGQGEQVINSGSMSQFDLAYGGSYRDRLYVGAGLGIVSSNFHSRRTFTESEYDPTTALNTYTLYDDVRTAGTGLNLRLGLIYRVSDALRVGASVQTPTWMYLTDTYTQSITARFDAVPRIPASTEEASTGTQQYAYNITTPFRANGGVAVTLGKVGFLSGDVEYVGYQQARLSSNPSNALGDNADFSADNAYISQTYGNAVNLRVGGEARLDIFRVRLGFARYGSPYSQSVASNANFTNLARNYYTAGLGLRQGSFFLDVAGMYTQYNNYYSPYSLIARTQPVVEVQNTRFTTTVTAGLTF